MHSSLGGFLGYSFPDFSVDRHLFCVHLCAPLHELDRSWRQLENIVLNSLLGGGVGFDVFGSDFRTERIGTTFQVRQLYKHSKRGHSCSLALAVPKPGEKNTQYRTRYAIKSFTVDRDNRNCAEISFAREDEKFGEQQHRSLCHMCSTRTWQRNSEHLLHTMCMGGFLFFCNLCFFDSILR